jgi:hypothetical protein
VVMTLSKEGRALARSSRPERDQTVGREPVSPQPALAAVTAMVAPDTDRFVGDLTKVIMHEVALLDHDDELRTLLRASVAENVGTVLHVLAHAVDPMDVDAPLPAITYARRLAQRDIPLTALLRAYRLGQERFLALALNAAARLDSPEVADVMIDLVHVTSSYVDRVSDQVAAAHGRERERWVQERDVMKGHWVCQILSGQPVDLARVEIALGYSLSAQHVAAEVWAEPAPGPGQVLVTFNSAAACLARVFRSSSRPLMVCTDESSAQVWVEVGESPGAGAEQLRDELKRTGLSVRMALGTVDFGLLGFRRSARHASHAKRLALSAGTASPRVVDFDKVAPVALLTEDEGDLGDFVRRTLRGLVTVEDKGEWLREALLAFLRNNRSYAETAKELHVHRNTVQYRVRKALEAYGRPLDGDLLGLRLALEAAHWRGSDLLP